MILNRGYRRLTWLPSSLAGTRPSDNGRRVHSDPPYLSAALWPHNAHPRKHETDNAANNRNLVTRFFSLPSSSVVSMSRPEAPRTTLPINQPLLLSSLSLLFILEQDISGIIFGKQSEGNIGNRSAYCFVFGVSAPTQICRYPLDRGSPSSAFKPYPACYIDVWWAAFKTFNIARLTTRRCVCTAPIEARGLQGRNSSSHFRGNRTAATMAVTVDSR